MRIRKNGIWRVLLLVLTLSVVLSASVVGMIYGKYAADLENDVDMTVTAQGQLKVTVTETGANVYTVSNTDESNMPAYLRLTIVVGLQNEDGKLWVTPATEGVEYTVEISDCTKLSDGYYYFNGICEKGAGFSVTVLPKTLPSGYALYVQLLAEGIQCIPDSAVQTKWEASFDSESGVWSKTSSN